MRNPHYQLDYGRLASGQWLAIDGVTEDNIDAFVLNVRLLTQTGDGLSIREIANSYEGLPSDNAVRIDFENARAKWNNHKAKCTTLKHPTEDGNISYELLFDTILYGGLAHVNPRKVDFFRWLTTQGFYRVHATMYFLVSLRIFLEVVSEIRDCNTSLLTQTGDNQRLHSSGDQGPLTN
jgi:hypothetical protein